MEKFLQNILKIVEGNIGFIPVLIGVYFISLLMFWYESKSTKKDKNSIFDQWFIVTTLMILWGRITYIITNSDQFFRWNWFYLPYEKYADSIYIFRAMPWRLFAIWDGGFLFIPMFLIYLIISYIYTVVIKRWRWREMMAGVIFSANILLGSTLLMYGAYIGQKDISIRGLILLVASILFEMFLKVIKYIYKENLNSYVNMAQVLLISFTLLETIFLSNTFLSQNISNLDKWHVYGYIGFSLFMIIAYLFDVKRASQNFDAPKNIIPKVTLNQAIRVK